jgi:hypothetical protein
MQSGKEQKAHGPLVRDPTPILGTRLRLGLTIEQKVEAAIQRWNLKHSMIDMEKAMFARLKHAQTVIEPEREKARQEYSEKQEFTRENMLRLRADRLARESGKKKRGNARSFFVSDDTTTKTIGKKRK